MGTHTALGLKRLWLLLQGQKVEKLLGKDPMFLKHGTANFTAMAIAGEVVRAFRYGKSSEQEEAHAAAVLMVGSQLRDGLLTVCGKCEQGAPDPHFNYHAAPVAAVRLVALEAKLPDLVDLTGAWYRALISYFRHIATPDGQILGPGFRGLGGPFCQVGDLLYREVLGLPHHKPVGPGEGGVWNDWRYAGAGVVRKMLRAGDDLGGAAKAAETVKLRVPVVVAHYVGGHVAWMLQENVPANCVEPVDWVSVKYHGVGKHVVEFGKRWEMAPPELEGAGTKLKAERIQ